MPNESNKSYQPCPACHQVIWWGADRCPHCGQVLHAGAIRVRGAIALVLGLLLVAVMCFLIVWTSHIIRHSADPGATTRFTGSPAAAAAIFAIYTFVLVFGFITTILGGWMLRYGWRSAKMKKVVWGFGVILWVAALLLGAADLF